MLGKELEFGNIAETSPVRLLAYAVGYSVTGRIDFQCKSHTSSVTLCNGKIQDIQPAVKANAETDLAAIFSLQDGSYSFTAIPLSDDDGCVSLWQSLQFAVYQRFGRLGLQQFWDQSTKAKVIPLVSEFEAALNRYPEAISLRQEFATLPSVGAASRGHLPVRRLCGLLALQWLGAVDILHPTITEAAEVMDEIVEAPPLSSAEDPVVDQAAAVAEPNAPAGGAAVDSIATDTTEQPGFALSTTSALSEAKSFLARDWLGAARFRFEDYLKARPDHLESKAYLAWIEFKQARDTSRSKVEETLLAITEAIANGSANADLFTYRGMLLRILNRHHDALKCFHQALQFEPGHPQAAIEKQMTQLRLQPTEWPEVSVESVKVNAKMIVQRRIGGLTQVLSFAKTEIRVGSAKDDDVIVSDVVLPQVAKRHCTVFQQNARFYVRRNASFGRVWVNDSEIEVRRDVLIRPEDVIRLGEAAPGSPNLEMRIFDVAFLHELGVRQFGRIVAA